MSYCSSSGEPYNLRVARILIWKILENFARIMVISKLLVVKVVIVKTTKCRNAFIFDRESLLIVDGWGQSLEWLHPSPKRLELGREETSSSFIHAPYRVIQLHEGYTSRRYNEMCRGTYPSSIHTQLTYSLSYLHTCTQMYMCSYTYQHTHTHSCAHVHIHLQQVYIQRLSHLYTHPHTIVQITLIWQFTSQRTQPLVALSFTTSCFFLVDIRNIIHHA